MIVYFKWGRHYIHTIYDQHLDISITIVQKDKIMVEIGGRREIRCK